MTKDFDRKWRQEDEEALDRPIIGILMALMMLLAVVLLVAFMPPVEAEGEVNNPHANTIGPEMHSYIRDSKIGRKQFVRLEDVE